MTRKEIFEGKSLVWKSCFKETSSSVFSILSFEKTISSSQYRLLKKRFLHFSISFFSSQYPILKR